MRQRFHELAELGRVKSSGFYHSTNRGDREGVFLLHHRPTGAYLNVIASDGHDWAESSFDPPAWEHVSVRVAEKERCPTWEEMCWVKGLFWDESECVVQFHPPTAKYVNAHKWCLHLWKPVSFELPTPPTGTLA